MSGPDDCLKIAARLCGERFPDAVCAFVAGSASRGEATEKSDIDFVVIIPEGGGAYREAVAYGGRLFEVFVLDEKSAIYYMGLQSERPVLAGMISEGVTLPGPCEASERLKRAAAEILNAGPSAMTTEEIERGRYMITDAINDLPARNDGDLYGTLSALFNDLAGFHLRANRKWSGGGKALYRALKRENTDLAERYVQAFRQAAETRDFSGIFQIADEILFPFGGRLAEGFKEVWTAPN